MTEIDVILCDDKKNEFNRKTVMAVSVGVAARDVLNSIDEEELAKTRHIYFYIQAEHIPRCSCCGTTENLHADLGSGGPYRCNSYDCVVF